jgi:hypothetical protein
VNEDFVERLLGANVRLHLGKHYLRKGDFAAALRAFVLAEQLFIKERGPDHQLVITAIMRQAECYNRLGDGEAACRETFRALKRMRESGYANHPMAKALADYLIAANCPQ